RYFIPPGEKGGAVAKQLVGTKPVVDLVGKGGDSAEVPTFSRRDSEPETMDLRRGGDGSLTSSAGMGRLHVGPARFLSARASSTLAGEPRGSARSEADQGSGVPEGLQTHATAAALSLERKFNDWLRSRGETRPAVFREIRRAALPDAMGRALAAFEGLFGVKIHVVRNLTPEVESWNGLTFRDGHLYVDATSQAPVTTVAAHEFTHQLRASAPELYAKLEAEVRRQGRLSEWLAERTSRAGNEKVDADLSVEELTADAVGDALADRGFLERMAKRNPSAFREMARRFVDFINGFLGRARDLGSNKYLTDVARFRDELADVLDRYAAGERGGGGKDGVAFDRETAPRDAGPTFYSALTRSIERAAGAPKHATAEQWKQWLDGAQRRGEFKKAERDWAGIDPFVASHKGKISRAAMQEFAQENRVDVREKMLRDEIPQDEATDIVPHDDGGFHVTDADGAVAGSAKHPEHALPGGENYRELLLTLPVKPPDSIMHPDNPGRSRYFQSPHFDERNVLAHVRMNDRIGPNGEKVLHVEEVQSDWHQQGRKNGYVDAAKPWDVFSSKTSEVVAHHADEESARRDALARGDAFDYDRNAHGVPDAPFKKEWPLLAMKRVLRYAAEHGYDRVTWTTGDQQAERYDLSKHITRLESRKNPDGTFDVAGFRAGGDRVIQQRGIADSQLDGVVGKDLASKIVAGEGEPTGPHNAWREFKGVDLKVGGEGMRAFYDKLLPNEINKYVKPWGAKVGETPLKLTDMPASEYAKYAADHPYVRKNRPDVHSLDITPAMRRSVMQGQPMFARRSSEGSDPSREPRASVENIEKVLSAPDPGGRLARAKAWVKGKAEDLRPFALGGLQTRHVLELMDDVAPLKGASELYGRLMGQLDADRTQLMTGSADAKDHPRDMLKKGAVTIAQELRQFAYGKGARAFFGAGNVRPAAKALFDLMHRSTMQRMDPSKGYERLTIENAHGDAMPWTPAGVKARLKLLKELAMQRGGDAWADREK
ncbi:MAG: hypothetical protein ACREPJ_00980, partial [Rhodanobacteraceae bacterium]